MRAAVFSSCAAFMLGCSPAAPPHVASEPVHASSPLGASYVLHPLPSEDDSILGRVLDAPPETGRALEELTRPNPCLEHLTERKESASVARFEDAQDLGFGGKGKAQLGAFGFSAEAERATHFVYRLETDKRVAQIDGPGYAECCAKKDCGYGFVSTLVHGEGELAAAEETQGKAAVDVTFAAAEGHARLSLLKRRHVKGWLAAMIRVTNPKQASAPVGPLGADGPHDDSVVDQVKALYAQEKIEVVGKDGASDKSYVFKDSRGEMTESEFIRRYHRVTGASDLDHLEGGHGRSMLIGGALAMVAGGGLLAFALVPRYCDADDIADGVAMSSPRTGCTGTTDPISGWVDSGKRTTTISGPGAPLYFNPDQKESLSVARMMSGILGGLFVVGGASLAILSFAHGEGSPDSHWMTQYDAFLYVQRYNRAVLRKVARDVQSSFVSTTRVKPSIGLALVGTGIALYGRF